MSRMSCNLLSLTALCCAVLTAGCPEWFPGPGPEEVEPVAAFSATPLNGAPPLEVQFLDESSPGSSPISRWDWDFGDGLRSAERNPVHTYYRTGGYTVSLTVTTAVASDTSSVEDYIMVQAIAVPPTAYFSATPTFGDVPLTVTFTDESHSGTSPITSWAWDFGDTKTSTQQNPSHIYDEAGVYTVSLTVTTSRGADTLTKEGYIEVIVFPRADFEASRTAIELGQTIEFTDLSTPGSSPITEWLWSFGDGAQSTQQNPSHTYSSFGVFDVSLTVTTAEASDTETKTQYIQVRAMPQADFTVSNRQPTVDTPVIFTDQSTGGSSDILTWRWDFGDGGQSSDRNPTHTYAVGGKYNVSLTVTTEEAEDTELKQEYITVIVLPTADFEATPVDVLATVPVSFTDLSDPGTGEITAWHWDFDDGATSTEQNPTHAYATFGDYTVTLTVTTQYGADSISKENYIHVVSSPTAAFTMDKNQVNVGEVIQFTDTSVAGSDEIESWAWDFGDESSSADRNPTHAYAAVGTYTITLTVTAGVHSDTESKTATVFQRPQADFTANQLQPYINAPVQFTDLSIPGSSAITSWQWVFGDGTTSVLEDPSHTYASAGTYPVSLTVTTAVGQDTEEKTGYITVISPLQARFTVFGIGELQSPVTVEVLNPVQFSNLSTPGRAATGDLQWSWTFGDTGSGAAQNPSHTYNAPGNYTVALTVSDRSGIETEDSTLTRLAYIYAIYYLPEANFSANITTVWTESPVQFVNLTDPGSADLDQVTWLWEFGDGQSSTEPEPEHAYLNAGTYTVTLTATSPYGENVFDIENYITAAIEPPTVDFTASNTEPGLGEVVRFMDLSTGGLGEIVSWLWDFGDNTTSTETHPSHRYATTGTFTVSLTVTTTLNVSDTEVKEAYIHVGVIPPDASFIMSDPNPYRWETIQFTDTSDPGTGPITQWTWQFKMWAWDNEADPEPAFTWAPINEVVWDDTEGRYTWQHAVVEDLEVAQPAVSHAQNPSYIFYRQSRGDAGGEYQITLTVITPNGSSSYSQTLVVNNVYPIANFSVDKDVVVLGIDPVTFTDLSVIEGRGYIDALDWDVWLANYEPALDYTEVEEVGENKYATLPEFDYWYPFHEAGMYNADLTAYATGLEIPGDPHDQDTDTWWSADTLYREQMIEAREPTPLDVFIRDLSGYGGYEKVATIAGDGYRAYILDMVSQTWPPDEFQVDTIPSEDRQWEHWLTVIVPDDRANDGVLLFLDDGPNGAQPTTSDLVPTRGGGRLVFARDFAIESESIVAVLQGTLKQPLQFADRPGEQLGADEIIAYSFDKFLNGTGAPEADFRVTPDYGEAPLTVQFIDSSTSPYYPLTSWSWDFGDGGTSTDQNPAHIYNNPGTYAVTLTVQNTYLSDTLRRTAYITVAPPGEQPCPGAPAFGQPPADPGEDWSVAASDEIVGDLYYEFFYGVEAIADVTWWGLEATLTPSEGEGEGEGEGEYEGAGGFGIVSVAPLMGSVQGGQRVTITGTFPIPQTITSLEVAYANYRVTIGDMPAAFDDTVPEIMTTTEIHILTPASASIGLFDVRVEWVGDPDNNYAVRFNAYRYADTYVPCNRAMGAFEITFYETSPGDPPSPGRVVAQTVVFPRKENTGRTYGGAPLYRYRATLETPVLLSYGWISIQAVYETTCPFLWMSSPTGNGQSLMLGADATETAPVDFDLSVCLSLGDAEIESHLWGDPNLPDSYQWPALYPMVRSAVRAMDTVEDFLSNPAQGGIWPEIEVDGFGVAGGGNCGWATWLTAVADPRVKGIIPMAFDGLSLPAQFTHQAMTHESRVSPFFEAWDPFTQPLPPTGQAVISQFPEYAALDDWWGSYFTAKMARKYLERIHRDIMTDVFHIELDDGAHLLLTDYPPLSLAALLTDPDAAWDWEVLWALYSIDGVNGADLGAAITDIGWHEGDEYVGTIAYTLANMPGDQGERDSFIWSLIGSGDPPEEPVYDRFPQGRLGAIIQQIKNVEDNLLSNKEDGSYQSWLLHLVDPIYYNYRYSQYLTWWWEFGSRLRIPKLLLNASGDQYFLPDASKLYFGQLDQPKWIRYLPNTDHGMTNTDFDLDGQSDLTFDFNADGVPDGGYKAMLLTALPWYEAYVNGEEIPEFTWQPLGEDGMIEVQTFSPQPAEVSLWTATSRTNDFRFDQTVNWDVVEQGRPLPTWNKFPLQPSQPNRYVVKVSPTVSDYTAFFVELEYSNGMTFTTTVTIIDPAAASEVVPPTADFTVDNGEPFPDDEVRFADFSTQGSWPITQWRWDFGDGTTSTARNARHTYAEPGVYTVTLTVIADDGSASPPSDALTRVDYITVLDPSPIADFTAAPQSALAGETPVTFTDLSVPGEDNAAIVSWLWDFGDGTTSGDRNPVHVYQQGGSYDVTLTVTAASSWSDTAIKPHYVHVTVAGQDMGSALKAYVDAFDGNYDVDVIQSTPGDGYTQHILRLTSQQWRSSAEVSPHLWRHWLTLIEPDSLQSSSGLLIISGGDNTDTSPSGEYIDIMVQIALATGSVTALIEQVPSEPLQFTGEASARSEDEIIAYSYDKFMDSYNAGDTDATWPLLLPMVKSVVRAMDSIQDFFTQRSVTVSDFVVTGASKRGWTTWLTAAYDATRARPRVKAIVPMVIDVLNIDEQMDHHRKAYRNYFSDDPLYHMYGGYTDSVGDYTAFGIMDELYTPGGQTLLSIVDPYEFREQIRIPKLLINSTGDQFFLPDAAQFYFDDLPPGPNYLNYVPNTDHGLDEQVTFTSLLAFYSGLLRHAQMPQVSWTYVSDNTLQVQTSTTPASVALWMANNPSARDFRLETFDPPWESSSVPSVGRNVYQVTVPDPESGWTAYMVQLRFSGTLPGVPYIFTTPVKVVPDVYPEPWSGK
jgi:PKD repeat protein